MCHQSFRNTGTTPLLTKIKITASKSPTAVAYPGISFGGVQQIQLRTEDRQNQDLGGGSPLVRGSGGSCNLIQEISFHIVQFS